VPQNLLVATSNLPQVLVSKFVENGETTQYTCPSGTAAQMSAARIATVTLCNTSATAVPVTVSVGKAGATVPVTAGRILSAYSLAAGDSIRLVELNGAMLGPGDVITASATGTGSQVCLVITGAVSS
jgi:hypothetical protein